MLKNNDYYMSKEDRKLAAKEDQSLGRMIFALLMTCAFGVITFFLVWRMHATMPSILIDFLPGKSHANPYRLYELLVITFGGFAWFITFALLWFRLSKAETNFRRKLITLGCWCGVAAVLFAIVEVVYRVWLFR